MTFTICESPGSRGTDDGGEKLPERNGAWEAPQNYVCRHWADQNRGKLSSSHCPSKTSAGIREAQSNGECAESPWKKKKRSHREKDARSAGFHRPLFEAKAGGAAWRSGKNTRINRSQWNLTLALNGQERPRETAG